MRKKNYTLNTQGDLCFRCSPLRGWTGGTCECAYHCTTCEHIYGPLQDDCCTCCKSAAERAAKRKVSKR